MYYKLFIQVCFCQRCFSLGSFYFICHYFILTINPHCFFVSIGLICVHMCLLLKLFLLLFIFNLFTSLHKIYRFWFIFSLKVNNIPQMINLLIHFSLHMNFLPNKFIYLSKVILLTLLKLLLTPLLNSLHVITMSFLHNLKCLLMRIFIYISM